MNVIAAIVGFIIGFCITLVVLSLTTTYSRGQPDRILDFQHNSDPIAFCCNVAMSSVLGMIVGTLFYIVYPLVFFVGGLVIVIAVMALSVRFLLNKFGLK